MDMSWASTNEDERPANIQGSKKWHEWRGKGLGSSDAAVLLGWSPWTNIHQLFEQKLGYTKPVFSKFQLSAMNRGKELEPKIRDWYEKQKNARFKESIAEGQKHAWMRASFDGACSDFMNPEDGTKGRIIEIKAPNKDDHALAVSGGVPDKYMAQVQWLLMVANVGWCDYVSYGSDGTYAVVPVKAETVIQGALERRGEIFWHHLQTKIPPVELPRFVLDLKIPLVLQSEPTPLDSTQLELALKHADEPTEQIDEQSTEGLVAAAIAAQDEAEAATARYEAIKEKLKLKLGTAEKMEAGEAVFGWQKRKGMVNYSIIPELIGIDLEQYRKDDTKAFVFKRVNQK